MGDLISRQAAIEAIRRLVIAGWGTDHGVMDSDVIYEALEDLPSAQPEQKRGKWKHLGGDEWCCNQCGNVIHTEGHWEHPLSNDRKMYHCNICGANMRGEQDG